MTCITEASGESNTRDRPRCQRQLADPTAQSPHEVIRTRLLRRQGTAILTWVERNFGYAIARAYADHTDSGSETGATATYVRASLPEVAAALAALTGEPHPLATTEGW
jgi:hypothetical protein